MGKAALASRLGLELEETVEGFAGVAVEQADREDGEACDDSATHAEPEEPGLLETHDGAEIEHNEKHR